MGGFLGSYLYQVDEKGRVTLPAAFRKGRDELAPFVLIKVHSDALTLYPEENWLDVEVRLREYARRTPRARHYALRLTSNATELTPDRQGRILIPERLREGAGITEEAMLVGALDKIEIWNPQRFEDSIGEADDGLGEIFAGIFA